MCTTKQSFFLVQREAYSRCQSIQLNQLLGLPMANGSHPPCAVLRGYNMLQQLEVCFPLDMETIWLQLVPCILRFKSFSHGLAD
jgi:hypothetical protein